MIEVEVGNKRNGPWLFPANGMLLRGRWDYKNVMHLSIGESQTALSRKLQPYGTFIPGMLIRVDLKRQTLSIVDALRHTEEGRKIWKVVHEHLTSGNPLGGQEPADDVVIDLTEMTNAKSMAKNWLHWIAKGIKDGDCIVTASSDKMPTFQEIEALDGEVNRHPYDVTSPR